MFLAKVKEEKGWSAKQCSGEVTVGQGFLY